MTTYIYITSRTLSSYISHSNVYVHMFTNYWIIVQNEVYFICVYPPSGKLVGLVADNQVQLHTIVSTAVIKHGSGRVWTVICYVSDISIYCSTLTLQSVHWNMIVHAHRHLLCCQIMHQILQDYLVAIWIM